MCISFFLQYSCQSRHYHEFQHRGRKTLDTDIYIYDCEDHTILNHDVVYTCKDCLADWDNYPGYASVTELTEVDFESKIVELLAGWMLHKVDFEGEYFDDYTPLSHFDLLDVEWLKFSRQCGKSIENCDGHSSRLE